MSWWGWCLVAAAIVVLIADWLIVMGADPKKWKGGRRE